MEKKGKELEEKRKIDLRAEKFKFKSNQKQLVFNAELEELVGKIKEANAQKDHKKVTQLIDQARSLFSVAQETEAYLTRRLEWRRLGCSQEYESQDIASDDEEDKKIRDARAAAQ